MSRPSVWAPKIVALIKGGNSSAAIAQIKVAPTVLFFGRAGVEIAERLVGGYIPDFYGAYLDERLRLARAVLRA